MTRPFADHCRWRLWGRPEQAVWAEFNPGTGASPPTSADMSTINGFTMTGVIHDVLTFNADAWARWHRTLVAGWSRVLVSASHPTATPVMQLLGAGGP